MNRQTSNEQGAFPIDKQVALRQIHDIYGIIEGNLKVAISGPEMMVVGTGVALIPLAEWFLKTTIDPFIVGVTTVAPALIFVLRTIFYWSVFGFLPRLFRHQKAERNALVEQLFEVGKLFPIIPVATSAALALVGKTEIISPIVLILIGTLFVWFGQFTSRIVSVAAWANIIAGIIGICISQLFINHLWAYLVAYQGCTFIIMGAALWYVQKNIAQS